MLWGLKHWLIARRFRKLFVAPFEQRIAEARRKHGRGVRQVRQEQRELVHAALRGRG